MLGPPKTAPDWSALYEIAETQAGYFTTSQAAEAGFSRQLLAKYLRNDRITRVRRGVYRLVHFPPSSGEDLVELWLWSDRVGVFSHDTALTLHGLTDTAPARIHMTVPASWKRRHIVSTPDILVLHHADLTAQDRVWAGPVPVTSAARTLRDALDDGFDPAEIAAAARAGLARNLFGAEEIRYLASAPSLSRTP